MYTYNKDDKSYTFSSDDLNIEDLIDTNNNSEDNANNNTNDGDTQNIDKPQENHEQHEQAVTPKKPKNIEVINGGNDLDISPVSDYLEIEKPRNEKKENIVIPENN